MGSQSSRSQNLRLLLSTDGFVAPGSNGSCGQNGQEPDSGVISHASPSFAGRNFWSSRARPGVKTVRRTQVKLVTVMMILALAPAGWAAGSGAAVTGVVRDAQGVAQMGALVQVLANDSVMVGTAFTDLHGRYLIPNLSPGKYEVRASAALFVPAMHENLQLRPGARAIVNLTLNALFDTTAWLPAERRKADEPSDDWKWTLRSAANRPILRLVEDGDTLIVSSSATETNAPVDHARASVTSGDGGFGTGGVHNVFALDRALPDGSDVVARADFGTNMGSVVRAPSTELSVGYQRKLGFAGAGRTVMAYQSHPEVVETPGAAGFEVVQMASAQKTELGDLMELEVGGDVYYVRANGYALASRPFLRITAHPTTNWSVGYRMATSRDTQSFAGLDSIELELPVAVMSQGRMQTESGLHQEWSVGRKAGKGMVQAAYYRDDLRHVALSGSGELNTADLAAGGAAGSASGGILADTSTDTFRLMGPGYASQGLNILITEPITPGLWVAVEYSNGSALSAGEKVATPLQNVESDLKPRNGQSATIAVRGRVLHTGTKVRASYRWQPEQFVSAVNPFAAFSDQAYLSFVVRQPVRCGGLLPAGLEATVDVSNLLEQGYRPFLSNDGKTLYLAQTPRTIQAGLAFNF